jgi:hypothetical protein
LTAWKAEIEAADQWIILIKINGNLAAQTFHRRLHLPCCP